MKIITIGDLHGSRVWRKINPNEWDHIVFVGDYVDSDEFSFESDVANLEELIKLKHSFPGKIVLLWGNHDLCYLFGGDKRHYASGTLKSMLPYYFSIFKAHRESFQASFQVGHWLWTHAGVVQHWFDNRIASQVKTGDATLAATFNRLFEEYYEPLFDASKIRGGPYEDGGIFWADRLETLSDPLQGYHQVVGHTKTRMGVLVHGSYEAATSVTYVDCLRTREEFFELDI